MVINDQNHPTHGLVQFKRRQKPIYGERSLSVLG
jgi:hypothetical protein